MSNRIHSRDLLSGKLKSGGKIVETYFPQSVISPEDLKLIVFLSTEAAKGIWVKSLSFPMKKYYHTIDNVMNTMIVTFFWSFSFLYHKTTIGFPYPL